MPYVLIQNYGLTLTSLKPSTILMRPVPIPILVPAVTLVYQSKPLTVCLLLVALFAGVVSFQSGGGRWRDVVRDFKLEAHEDSIAIREDATIIRDGAKSAPVELEDDGHQSQLPRGRIARRSQGRNEGCRNPPVLPPERLVVTAFAVPAPNFCFRMRCSLQARTPKSRFPASFGM